MSPEQAEGREIDARSDIFSFGSVLYEMVTGRQAFQGKSTVSVISARLERDPELPPTLPPPLRRTLCRCLRKDPAQRWQSIAEVKLALEDIENEIACAPPPRRKSLWYWSALPLAVAALAATGYIASKYARPRSEDGARSFLQVTDDAGNELHPTLSPDGRTVVYASRASGNWDIYLLRVGGQNPVNLTKDSAEDDTEPAFSPDGERIAFRSERGGGGIFLMGATGESVRRLADFCHLPAWSPDGREIACSTVSPSRPDVREVTSSQVFVIDIESGKRRLVSGGIVDAVEPSWSPDGRRIAFWGLRDGRLDIFTAAREGGDVTYVTGDEAQDFNPVWEPGAKYLYFSSDRNGAVNLWRVPIDQATGKTSGKPEAVTVPSIYATSLSFSRDGRRLAYLNCRRSSNLFRADFDPARETVIGPPKAITQGLKDALYPSISHDREWIAFSLYGVNENLAVVKPDGSMLRRITEDEARDHLPRWSPDGRQIAFMSTRSGRFEIWTIRSDGSDARQVTEASPPGGVSYPAWSPDAKKMSYNLPDQMGYIIEAGKPWKEQQPQLARGELPEGAWFWANDWSHDGRRLAGTIQRLDGTTLGLGVYSTGADNIEQVTTLGRLPRWLPGDRSLLFEFRGHIHLADIPGKRTREILALPGASISPYFDVSSRPRLKN